MMKDKTAQVLRPHLIIEKRVVLLMNEEIAQTMKSLKMRPINSARGTTR